MRRSSWVVVAVLALAAASSAACGQRQESGANLVRQAMAATARAPRSFVYTATEAGATTVVRAQVQDDLRYKASVSVDGKPWLEEIAVDDGLADRVLDQRVVATLRRPGQTSNAMLRDAVGSGKWLVDPVGAPSLLAASGPRRVIGIDPVLDAMTAFRHVEQALVDAGGAHRFNPDSLDYRPEEDPFPRPRPGVVRYDLERPRLPRPEDVVGGGARALPGPANFRRLSVYVRQRDGRVVDVRETMDVATRLRDIRRLYDIGIPAGASRDAAVAAAVTRFNELRRPTGGEPIRMRTVMLSFVDVGSPVTIALPSVADSVVVDLSYFRDRGAKG